MVLFYLFLILDGSNPVTSQYFLTVMSKYVSMS